MFGEQVMVELVAGVGFYGMVAMTLNAFDVPTLAGKKPLDWSRYGCESTAFACLKLRFRYRL
jgi:hypothetical protein